LKAAYIPTNDEIRAERKRRYLERWPAERQMEAFSEAAMERPEKLNEMKGDFVKIREVLPFFEEAE
jgi:hypothetical protein